MKLTEQELSHLLQILGGPIEPTRFTAEGVIALRAKVAAELADKRREIPQDWRTAASEFVAEHGLIVCADPAIVEAERKRVRFINERAEKAAQQRDREHLVSLDPTDLLKELGL